MNLLLAWLSLDLLGEPNDCIWVFFFVDGAVPVLAESALFNLLEVGCPLVYEV